MYSWVSPEHALMVILCLLLVQNEYNMLGVFCAWSAFHCLVFGSMFYETVVTATGVSEGKLLHVLHSYINHHHLIF